jgi:hypothetical protein
MKTALVPTRRRSFRSLINEMVIRNANGNRTIPAFNSPIYDVHGHQLPNWVLASTTFDTTGRGGQSLIFWVVVWAQDANGNLVAELPGHGLTAVPGSLQEVGGLYPLRAGRQAGTNDSGLRAIRSLHEHG